MNVGTIQVILNANKFTKAPEGLIYYRICEPGDICRAVRGALAAQRLRLPQLIGSQRARKYEQPKEPTPEEVREEVRLAKERAAFKEMMQAKREAKQAARAEEEKAEFLDFMREWIATKWDGEVPDHLQKALSTGDPKDLGMLISEWHAYGGRTNNQASDATFVRHLDFPLVDQSEVVEAPPAGFVYFVRNGDLF